MLEMIDISRVGCIGRTYLHVINDDGMSEIIRILLCCAQAIHTRERLAGMVLDEAYNWLTAGNDDVRPSFLMHDAMECRLLYNGVYLSVRAGPLEVSSDRTVLGHGLRSPGDSLGSHLLDFEMSL